MSKDVEFVVRVIADTVLENEAYFSYTEKEDLGEADLIVTCLGDPNGERGVMTKGALSSYDGVLHLSQLLDYLGKEA